MKPYILFPVLLLLATNMMAQDEPLTIANKCYDDKNYQCSGEQYQKALDTKGYQEKDRSLILFRIGYGYNQLQKRKEAVHFFEEAIALKPDYADAYWSMAGNYYGMKEYDKATESYSKAIELLKNSPADLKTLYYWRGMSYNAIYEDSLARIDFLAALNIDSTIAGNYVGAADASFNTGRYTDAARFYRRAIQLGDDDKKIIAIRYYWLGQSYEKLLSYEDALTSYKKALDFNPSYEQPQWAVAACYYNIKKWELAIQEYTKTIPLYKKDTSSLKSQYYFRGRGYAELKQYDKALEDYESALKMDPKYRDAVWQKASALSRMKKYKDAVPIYTKTIELFKGEKNSLDDIYYFRGFAYLQLKDTVNARLDFLQSIAYNGILRDPNIQMGHISYGNQKYYEAKDYFNTGIAGYVADSTELSRIYFRKGMANILAGDAYFYTGKTDLQTSIGYDSTNKEAHRYMADVYYRTNQFLLAEGELNKCIRFYKNEKDSLANIYSYRALPRWQQKNYKGALEDYEQADKLKKFVLPDNIKAMGQLAYEVKDYNKAMDIFTRLIPMYKAEQKDDLMFAYYGRGRAAFELKKKDASVNDLKKALELAPGNKDITDWLTKAQAL